MRQIVRIDVDDFALQAELHQGAGEGADTPVVLLHGLSQQRCFWDPVIRRLTSRPALSVDQRGHGESDTALDVDYSVAACARDVLVALDTMGWARAVIVGHSWGAFVAHHFAARNPDRVAACVLVDGGLWALADDADRAAIREQLRPPALAMEPAQLWQLVKQGDLGPNWTSEVQAALAPTFMTGDDGLMRTRIGMDRHMLVLDGLLAHDPADDLRTLANAQTPVWVVSCGTRGPRPNFVDLVDLAETVPHYRVLRSSAAVHDVPLQWPALVAGLIDTAVQEGTW